MWCVLWSSSLLRLRGRRVLPVLHVLVHPMLHALLHLLVALLDLLAELRTLFGRQHVADIQHCLQHAVTGRIVLGEHLLAQRFRCRSIHGRRREDLQGLLVQRAARFVLSLEVGRCLLDDLLDLGALCFVEKHQPAADLLAGVAELVRRGREGQTSWATRDNCPAADGRILRGPADGA